MNLCVTLFPNLGPILLDMASFLYMNIYGKKAPRYSTNGNNLNKGTAKRIHPLGIQFKNMAKHMANDLDINVMYQKTNVICPCLY